MTVLNFPTDDRDILALCERADDRMAVHLGRYGTACAPLSAMDLCESILNHRTTPLQRRPAARAVAF